MRNLPTKLVQMLPLLLEIFSVSYYVLNLPTPPLLIFFSGIAHSKVENQDPWKFHEFLLNTLGNTTSFLVHLHSVHWSITFPLWQEVPDPPVNL